MKIQRRQFLARSASVVASTTVAYQASASDVSKNSRLAIALIGAGYQPDTKRKGRGIAIGAQAAALGDLTMICEVDDIAGAHAKEKLGGVRAKLVSDYRHVIDNPNVDAVLIATPDHWHTKIAVEAMRAGKDVYCEKPVATTIQEGKLLRQVAAETNRVLQIGTQQRTEYNHRFLTAVAMVQHHRIGRLKRVLVGLGPGWKGGPFESTPAPQTLDWNQWLGPAPKAAYLKERTHRTFRWWFEYAGGQICDWGAHHVDIAQWAIAAQTAGVDGTIDFESCSPLSVDAKGTMNQPLANGMPTKSDWYNTPIDFTVSCSFPDDIQLVINDSRNGITFEGDQGRFFVNRGTLEGRPVSMLQENPLPVDSIRNLYGARLPTTHMDEFFRCVQARRRPISDIRSHHRTLTTCHLANLSLRLNRKLKWDGKREQVVADEQANGLLDRPYREGFEIENA